jgi:hypothetical protein
MSRLGQVLSGVVVLASLGVLPNFARADTNTNQCAVDLGSIQVCQDRNFLGLPNDLGACCDGVRKLAQDQCECNPALDVVLGEEGTKIYDLEPLCRLVQPLKWFSVTPRVFRSCSALQKHEYGCAMTDMEIDAARLTAITSLQKVFKDTTNEAMCLDTPAFVAELANSFAPDVHVTVPYGVGTYSGIHDVAEYLGMAFAGLTHGFWEHDITPDTKKPGRLEVSGDGSVWTTAATTRGSFVRDALPYTDLYLEQDIAFRGCETLVADYDVHPTEGMRFLIERYVQATDLSKRWGLEDICRYHTQFCAGDPATRQYESEAECLEYLGSLPLYTEACGPNRPLAGHSLSCKFKHHFMIPTNPMLHCPHIGKVGHHDPNHKLKCDDVSECSVDQGQASWPAVNLVGSRTPANVVEAYTRSNVGYESEPFGCAVPTAEHEHGH